MFTDQLLKNFNEDLLQLSTEQLPGRVLLNAERDDRCERENEAWLT